MTIDFEATQLQSHIPNYRLSLEDLAIYMYVCTCIYICNKLSKWFVDEINKLFSGICIAMYKVANTCMPKGQSPKSKWIFACVQWSETKHKHAKEI